MRCFEYKWARILGTGELTAYGADKKSLSKYDIVQSAGHNTTWGQDPGWLASVGVGVTKDPFVDCSVSEIFELAKVPLRLLESHSYLTDATAATPAKYKRDIQ